MPSGIKRRYIDQWIPHKGPPLPPPPPKKNLHLVAESCTNALSVDHISQQSQEFDKKQRIVKKRKQQAKIELFVLNIGFPAGASNNELA